MNQFMRLMFSPVAGCMVRTLFLERLRAERELAAPADVRLERIITGLISPARSAWAHALAKVKLPQAVDAALPADTLELVDVQGLHHRVALRVLDDASDADGAVVAGGTVGTVATVHGTHAVLAPAGPYGRVMEIVAADDASVATLAALAARLWSLPWRTPGPRSVLQQLRGMPLAQQVAVAAACAAAPGAGDPAFLDVAACLAGIAPAWSGGPLTWQRTQPA